MQTADVRAASENHPACILLWVWFFYLSHASQALYPSTPPVPPSHLSDGAVRAFVCYACSTRPGDLRGEIKRFQAVTVLVGGWSNIIIRFQPAWVTAVCFYGALGRVLSRCCCCCCWRCGGTHGQDGSFRRKRGSIFQADNEVHETPGRQQIGDMGGTCCSADPRLSDPQSVLHVRLMSV